MPSPSRAGLVLGLAALLGGLAAGCRSPGIRIDVEQPAVAVGAPQAVVAPVVDARVFGAHGSLGRQHSVQGDAADPALTARVVGRRLVADSSLAGNVMLAQDQSVAGLVGEALVLGLRRAGWDARLGAPGTGATAVVRAEIVELWLRERRHSRMAAIGYRAELRVHGDVPGLERGRPIQVDASVAGGAADATLWRRALERTLEAISERVSERALPAEPAGPGR